MGLYRHRHKCGFRAGQFFPDQGCGHVWSHDPFWFGPNNSADDGHKCPACGKGPWWSKFQGETCETGATVSVICGGNSSSSVKCMVADGGTGNDSILSPRAVLTGCNLTRGSRGWPA